MKPDPSTFSKQIWRNTVRRKQRGSIVVNTAIALSLIVIVLIGTELGYLFFMKREFQKTADLAALAGARRLGPSTPTDPCGTAKSDARTNAAINLPGVALTEIDCGRWAPGLPGEEHFEVTNIGMNALRVHINAEPPLKLIPSFGGSRFIQASAIAVLGAPQASFSVGTKLVTVDGNASLGQMLKAIGLDLSDTTLVGYEGLAQLKITPAGLLKALKINVAADVGIGELNALLAGRTVTLGELLDATLTAADQSAILGVNADLLDGLLKKLNLLNPSLTLEKLNVQLGSLTDPPKGLFAQIRAPAGGAASALKVEVGVFDLITTAVGIATKRHAVELPHTTLLNTVSARVALIEAPSIGIGGVGTTAYTGQLRTYINVDTKKLPVLGNFVRLNLPIMIDAVTGTGTVTEMCTAKLRTDGVDHARIQVDASILKVCIGKPGANPALENEIFSTSASCSANLVAEQLFSLSLPILTDIVSLKAKVAVDPLPLSGHVDLAAGETGTVGNELLLGTTLKNLTDALLAALLGQSLGQMPAPTEAQRTATAQALWGEPCPTRACRQQRLKQVKADIDTVSGDLSKFIKGLPSATLGIVGELLTLNLAGVLQGVGGLVTNLLSGVGDLLGGILEGIFGNKCTGGPFDSGSDIECVKNIAESLKGNGTSNGQSIPNAVTAFTGFVFQLLKPLLDGLGKEVLTPLLRNVLGLHLGQVDIHLKALECQAQPILVY